MSSESLSLPHPGSSALLRAGALAAEMPVTGSCGQRGYELGSQEQEGRGAGRLHAAPQGGASTQVSEKTAQQGCSSLWRPDLNLGLILVHPFTTFSSSSEFVRCL